jgi:hypothetical protein
MMFSARAGGARKRNTASAAVAWNLIGLAF